MKRALMILILVPIVIGLFGVPAAPGVVFAQQSQSGDTIDLIIQTDGTTEAVVDQVEALGGTVNFAYQNVPAVAITIPAGQMAGLANLPGVTYIEKDKLLYPLGVPRLNPDSPHPRSYQVEDASGINVKAVDPKSIDLSKLPEGYANFIYTGADQIWEETGSGEGSLVAVVDTGTAPNACLSHAVVGAPGFPDGYNATGDGIPATDPSNHWHGTHVGGVIASACAMDFSADPTDPLYQAISAYLPWPVDFVPILGQAPMAQLYPVKVFPQDGSGSPTSVIMDGLDHVLTLKKSEVLDIDIVNMSLGGSSVYDGRDTFDRFLKELYSAKILVVAAAGNNGPVPNSVGSPATSIFSIAAGALDYAPSSRVLYEYIGLTSGLGAGEGLVMRPTSETRVANFSSRGPLSDGRMGPDITALGMWNFHVGPMNELRWATGTSFSSPTVAGAAALLNAYQETVKHRETPLYAIRSALFLSANPKLVGHLWRDVDTQGFGALNAQAAFKKLKSGDLKLKYPVRVGKLEANVLGKPVKGSVETYRTHTLTLKPSQKFDAVFAISPYTSKVTIEIYDIVAPDNSATAYWPNSLEVHVQSAKRTDVDHPIAVYWYPLLYGDSFTIEIEDGPWALAGEDRAYQPMEAGLMKVALIGDYSNESPVKFKMRLVRENNRTPLTKPVAKGKIKMGEALLIPVKIPPGARQATFDLAWNRDWSKFPSSDLDMVIFDPDFNLVSLGGATFNAPERAVVENPIAGTWQVYIQGYEMYRPDVFKLFVRTESAPYPEP